MAEEPEAFVEVPEDEQEAIYAKMVQRIFFDHYRPKTTEFVFDRSEILKLKAEYQVEIPRNPGDLPYKFRFRSELPDAIIKTQPKGLEWIIELAGRAKYRFKLGKMNRVLPREELQTIAIPDATPEIIRAYRMNDEQALLALIRYNRLLDIFLGIATYSLQNHLRTTVKGMGQIEIDELYFGIDKRGCHYAIPVQAKGGKDKLGVVQAKQDIAWCEQHYPGIRCRAISAQFMADNRIALFELTVQDELIKVVDEKHYRLSCQRLSSTRRRLRTTSSEFMTRYTKSPRKFESGFEFGLP
ncbi:MAG TPA: hypothetical protein VHU18_00955 [Rhizomicrobium sp.]|nr:hypothetical protein [Rhizomicrobium sp.]